MELRPLRSREVPAPVRALLALLAESGHPSFLVGGCVRDLLRGTPVADFDVTTPATGDELLELLPRAVPIGLHHGTLMVPTRSGPVDVTSFRKGPRLEDDLAHRDFTVNAMAFDPDAELLIDPFGGRVDLERGVLRAVGSAVERFAEDPLRALRACRLVSVLGLEIDAEVLAALPGARPGLARVARERVRHELCELLLGEAVAEALALLRRSGIEADLAPGAPEDAAAVAAALPPDLELRAAGWLRGARTTPILRALRFPRRSVETVAEILRAHPIEQGANGASDVVARRVLRRVGEHRFGALAALRRAELSAGAQAGTPAAASALARLAELEQSVARVRRQGALALRRFDLALDGADVMKLLGCGPGPSVGRALRHLTDCVVEDPSRNTPDALRTLLADWIAAQDRP